MSTAMIISTAGLVSALTVLITTALKITRWVDRQTAQDADIRRTREEQELLTRGVLACLKGLQEVGCDGPVDQAIIDIETYLNRAAHQ